MKDARIDWRTLLFVPSICRMELLNMNTWNHWDPDWEVRRDGCLTTLLKNGITAVPLTFFHDEAVAREAARGVWRAFYKSKAVFDLRQVQVATLGVPLVSPNQLDDPIVEPTELYEFLAIIRFDEVALPLLTAGLMTSRGLALTLRCHIPLHIKRVTLTAMMRGDEKRFTKGQLLVDKDELMALAQKKEGFLSEIEAEMRAAGQ